MLTEDIELLRFTTAGSVDDGKSTLIGRLLYDSKSIFEDQLSAVEQSSQKRGLDELDFSLLTDGLKDEREQGITIDVAYRYFSTPKRKFIIADTPGHIQYTRNMVTGASNANLALILVDVRNGVIEQTKRHAFIASLLQIPHLIVCINKMDLVDYSEEAYEKVIQEFNEISHKLQVKDIQFIPISALKGDNVVNSSENMDWYHGATLLHTLETVHISNDENFLDSRFPVQTVIRPHSEAFHDFRGYAGMVTSGVFKKGEEVIALPSGMTSTIQDIMVGDDSVETAYPPMSVVMTLEDDIDISRGNMLVRVNNQPEQAQDLDAMICWFSHNALQTRKRYLLKHTTNEVKAMVKEVLYKVDINTMSRNEEDLNIRLNDICRVKLRSTQPLMTDPYRTNRRLGAFIIVDEMTHETLGAGMIR
ncbi:GTP-binding protein [bacterium SCSIO 12741]|nr:GTP-binding protein [bacterium SCSIO 12741]